MVSRRDAPPFGCRISLMPCRRRWTAKALLVGLMASPAIAQSEATIVSNVQELRSLVARQSQLAPAIRGYSFGSWTGEVRGKRVLLDEVALE